MNNINLLLIEEFMSLERWLGIISTILIGLLAYLLKDAYNRIIERLKNVEGRVEVNEGKINSVKENGDKEFRLIDNKFSDFKMNIIEKLETIKEKVTDARK